MIRCLIVDDDSSKVTQIIAVVTQEFGDDGVDVSVADSAYDAASLMKQITFDLLIIDLNLPMRHGEAPSENGGKKLLHQIGRGANGLARPSFVVGVTAYEPLIKKNLSEFHEFGWALVQYEPSSNAWEKTVANQCRHVIEMCERYTSHQNETCDVCICTALADPELKAVIENFSAKPELFQGDSTRFFGCVIEAGGQTSRIVLASASEMGTSAMASLTTKMLSLFRPRMFILAGICAGIRSEIGDIVVAESALNFESGKWSQEEAHCEAVFAPEPRYQSASPGMLAAVQQFKTEKASAILSLPALYQGIESPKQPTLNIGPVACGAAVIESKDIVDGLNLQNRKLEGLEMESYGFYLACRNAYPGLEYAMIKAVCDTARPPKEDRFQGYAAHLSANASLEFIRHELTIPNGILKT